MDYYYIIDKTLSQDNKPIYYSTLNEVINHLEGAVKRKFNQSRRDFMLNLVDLGHPADEKTGRNFVNALYPYFEMGVTKQLRHVKCNLHDVDLYSKYKPEMGN
jgi:hypothetical protein